LIAPERYYDGWLHVARPVSYAEATSRLAEEVISCTHGGGYYHILDFLEGRSRGYRLERGGSGLQLTPERPGTSSQRDKFYTEGAVQYLDDPAILIFETPRGRLDSANNLYEAGLRAEDRDAVSNVKIFNLVTKAIFSWTPEKGATPIHLGDAINFDRELRKAQNREKE
jgi:hypothetical protein